MASRQKLILSLFIIATVGLLIRLGYVIVHPESLGLKRLEFSVIAENLNAGRGLTFDQYGTTYHAWKEPLYILLLASLMRVVDKEQQSIVLGIIQSLFGIATALGIGLLSYQIFRNVSHVLIAGLLVAANPFLVYYDTRFMHPLSLDSFLFVLTITLSLSAIRSYKDGMRRTVLAGIAAGISLWERTTIFIAGIAMWGVAWFLADRRRILIAHAATWLLISLTIIAPWLIRNYSVLGRAVLTTDAAHILWLGNNPASSGTYSDLEGNRVIIHAEPGFRHKLQGATELAQYDLFLNEVRRFVREHPWQWGTLTLRKLVAFFWFSPNAGIDYTAWEQTGYRVGYLVLLTLGLLGLVLYWERATDEEQRMTLILLSSVMGLAILHALTAINLKHRVPWELILALFCAETIVRGMTWVGNSLNII